MDIRKHRGIVFVLHALFSSNDSWSSSINLSELMKIIPETRRAP